MRIFFSMIILVLLAKPCISGSIGLFATPEGTGCNLSLLQGETATIYAVGRTDSSDPSGGVIDSGEFRVSGLPAGWFAASTPNPSFTVVIGDLFSNGAVFAWPLLQSGVIPLFTISIFATTQVENVVLQVVKHNTPSPPFGFPTTCPWFHYSCGGPCDTSAVCVDGGSFFINGSCTVGVERQTWSGLRSLYR